MHNNDIFISIDIVPLYIQQLLLVCITQFVYGCIKKWTYKNNRVSRG